MAELGQCECGNYANYCEGCFDKYMKEEVVKQQAKRIKIPLDAVVREWVAVSDRLPEHSTPLDIKTVLVWHDNRVRFGCYFEEIGWRLENSPSEWNVDFWMELPSKPTA